MHHLQDGLFFQRIPNSHGVRLIKTKDGKEPNTDNVDWSCAVNEERWAGVIAAVSLGGHSLEKWNRARLLHGVDLDSLSEPDWYGVDLDRTLARYEGWTHEGDIGEPIPAMFERVKQWIEEGKIVKIFTARADHGPTAIKAVEGWCEKHFGRRLPVTNIKSHGLVELWDDRARQVRPNTGELVC